MNTEQERAIKGDQVKNFVRIVIGFLFLSIGFQAFAEEKKETQPSQAAFQAVFLSVDDVIDATGPALIIKKHRQIKLLSPAAIERFSTLEFPSTPSQQVKVDAINITTPDGISKPVSLDQIKEIQPFEKIPSLNTFKILGVQMKDIAPGSTLEYSLMETDTPWLVGEYWQDIPLQETEPVPIIKEQVSLTEFEGKQADVKLSHGTLPTAQVTKGQGTVTRSWTFEKIPPYIPQMFMPSPMDLIPRLEISTLKGWGKVADAEMSQFFIPLAKADTDKLLADLLKDAKTDDEKMAAVYGFVAQTIRSLPAAVSDLNKIPHPLNFDDILKEGYGDARDKAALLSELLSKIGFTPQIVVLSPISNGAIAADFPLPSSMTRPVVKVENKGKTLWFDPYVESSPYGYLPPEDQGRPGLVLPSGTIVETAIYPPSANLRTVKATATLRAGGDLEESLEVKANGADALGIRSVLRNIEDKERQQVLASLAYQLVPGSHPPSVQAVTSGAIGDLSAPVTVGLKFEAKNYATVAGDLTLLSMPIGVLDYLKAVLAQPSPRPYPFVLGNTVSQNEHFELTIPDGYRIRTVPQGTKVANAVGSYQAAFTQSKNKLIFNSSLTLDKLEYDPKEFEALKSMIADRAKVEDGKIVLERTGSASKPKRKLSLAK